MIWLEEQQTRKKVSKIFYRYEKTFPKEERRDKDAFLSLAENPNAFVYTLHLEDLLIGYAIIWELSDFFFLEHFEVFEEYRNQKFGEQTLAVIKEKYEKIILETEPETLSEKARRRLSFYERNGFKTIDKNYLQPSYGEGLPSLPLLLLGNYAPENLKNLTKEIYAVVYAS